MLVLCEGQVTEPRYFEDLKADVATRLVDVDVSPEGATPKTLVERAVARRKEDAKNARRDGDPGLAYDEIWCVFDVDEHPFIPDARQQARDNKIRLAVSNPSFELWVLLHFEDQTGHIERAAARSRVRKHIPDYEKHVRCPLLRGR